MPPPPGWFSMTMVWPSASANVGCRMRASASIGPPAANGTTIVSGRLGQSCACAFQVSNASMADAASVLAIMFPPGGA